MYVKSQGVDILIKRPTTCKIILRNNRGRGYTKTADNM